MTTVADFLRTKVTNMSAWLMASGCTLARMPDAMSDLALVTFAHMLTKIDLRARDFRLLEADKENWPADVNNVLAFVEAHPELHDKFWRYLQLFSETVSSDE